jgi:hypothetical protein
MVCLGKRVPGMPLYGLVLSLVIATPLRLAAMASKQTPRAAEAAERRARPTQAAASGPAAWQ